MRERPVRTWRGDGVELVGLRPFTVENVYEFVLDDGSSVHLHDGHCTQVSYQPSEQTMTLTFEFDPEWSPSSHPAGCRVWLVFTGATLIKWEHADGPSEYVSQCRDLGHYQPKVFSLELPNDSVCFDATGIKVFVDGRA